MNTIQGNTMNQVATIQQAKMPVSSTTSLVLDTESIDKMMKLADIMSRGVSTIPEHLRGNPSDCLAVVMQSMQWKMNPYAVAQKTHTVKGVLGYEAQLVNAVITSIAPTKDRLNYEWFGDWSKVTGKFKIMNGDKGEYRVPGWKLADEQDLGIRVWATIKGEDKPRVLELLLAQARTRNSTLWADDPQQQLAYLATKKWSRLHAPDVILGVYTPDELDYGERKEIDITPPTEPEVKNYSDEDFKTNFPKWQKLILSGKKTADDVIKTVSSKTTLTDDQIAAIKAVAIEEGETDENA